MKDYNERERDKLMEAVPEYYSEAVGLYGEVLLPPQTEEMADLWRNRTTAENAAWLIGYLVEQVTDARGLFGQVQLLVAQHGQQMGVAAPPPRLPWDGRERRAGDDRRTGDVLDRRGEGQRGES